MFLNKIVIGRCNFTILTILNEKPVKFTSDYNLTLFYVSQGQMTLLNRPRSTKEFKTYMQKLFEIISTNFEPEGMDWHARFLECGKLFVSV